MRTQLESRTVCLRKAAACLLLMLIVLAAPSVLSAQSETVEYYGLDALGSVRVMFDAQGNVLSRMEYGPFGEALTGAIKFPPEQFAQLSRDPESGHDYAKARTYSTSTGRLNRVDPVFQTIFDPQQLNRYGYARNNPVSISDPSGEVIIHPLCEGPCWDSGEAEAIAKIKLDFQLLRQSPRGNTHSPRSPRSDPTDETPKDDPKDEDPPKVEEAPKCVADKGPVQFLSVGAVFAPLLGPDVSFGVYKMPETGEWGFFGSRGVAVGLSYGAGVQVGQVSSMKNFQGRSTTLNAGLGLFAGTVYRNGDKTTGASGGWAGGLPNIKVGAHAASVRTTVVSMNKGDCQ